MIDKAMTDEQGGVTPQDPVKGPAPITLEPAPVTTDAAPGGSLVTTDAAPPPDVVSNDHGFSIQFLPDGDGFPSKGTDPIELPDPFATVEGFKPGTDKIDFSLIDGDAKTAGAQDFTFDGDLTSAPEVGHVGVTHSGDDVLVAFNDGSSAEPHVLALLDVGSANLTATDFVL